jgi:hypothetical protein
VRFARKGRALYFDQNLDDQKPKIEARCAEDQPSLPYVSFFSNVRYFTPVGQSLNYFAELERVRCPYQEAIQMDHWFRAHRKLAARVTLGALVSTLAISTPRPSSADHESELAWTGVMVGAFDDVTGVPVMGKLLEIMKSEESLSYSPEALDQRLRAVEEHLQQIDSRLQQVAIRVGQLQNEAVRNAATDRLRELQRIRGEIVLVNAGLRNNPNAFERSQLTLKAEQMADQLKNSPNFDTWQWTTSIPQAT